jgi:hypothetical protein
MIFTFEDTFHCGIRKNLIIINIVTRETEFVEETGGPVLLKVGLFFFFFSLAFESWDCSQIWKFCCPSYVFVTFNNVTWRDILTLL